MKNLRRIAAVGGLASVLALSGCGAILAGASAQRGYAPGVVAGVVIGQYEAAQVGKSQVDVNVNQSEGSGDTYIIDQSTGRAYKVERRQELFK